MRSLYNPGNIISSILSPVTSIFGGSKEVAKPQVTSAADDKAKSDAAAAEKAAEERKAAGARTGTSATLLTPPSDVSLLGTRRRTLGSS